jgi:hypothetical protein
VLYNGRMPSRPQFSLRMLMFVVVIVCLAAATVSPVPAGQQIAAIAQTLLRAALCVAFPAMLATGAIHARGYRRTFFVGGLFPAVTALVIVCLGIASQWNMPAGWNVASGMVDLWGTTDARASFLVGLWAFVPISGLVCVFTQWLLGLGAATDRRRDDQVESSGP